MWAYSIVRRWRNWPVRSMSWWPRWVSDDTARPHTTVVMHPRLFQVGMHFKFVLWLCKCVLDRSNSRCLCLCVVTACGNQLIWTAKLRGERCFGVSLQARTDALKFNPGYWLSRIRNFCRTYWTTHINPVFCRTYWTTHIYPCAVGSRSAVEAGYILDGKEIRWPTVSP